MAMTNTLVRSPFDDPVFRNFRSLSVGFDNFFKQMLNVEVPSNYPPYNILQLSPGKFVIEVALAGFKKEDISVCLSDGNNLRICRSPNFKDKWLDTEDVSKSNGDITSEPRGSKHFGYAHCGISKRNFHLNFQLAEDIEIHEAKMENGILSIILHQRPPDEVNKSVQIEIK